MERKEFIKQCGKLCLGGVMLGGILESCTTNYYAVNNCSNDLITVKKTEFIDSKDGKNKPRKYVLVRTERLTFPICIYKLNENTYTALFMECTHKSCELNPHGDFLICPCHGSEFSNVGKVQNPPAENDLKSFKITHDNDNIYVHIS